MMTRLLTTMVSAGLFVAAAGAARAGVLFDTVGGANQVAHLVATHAAAESFVASSSNLGDVEVDLSAPAGSTGSIVISIASDSGNAPGTLLDTVYTLQVSAVPTAETLYDFNNLQVTDLTAGSKYWLVISQASSNVYVSTSAPSTGVDTTQVLSGATDYWRGTGSGITATLMVACVSTDNSCDAAHAAAAAYTFNEAPAGVSTPPIQTNTGADQTDVPEPASIALLAAGLAGLGVARRRKA